MSFRLFAHAVSMLFSNLGASLRISGVLYLLSFVFSLTFYLGAPDDADGQGFPWLALLGSIISTALFLWLAVGWHRYVLLGEQPGALLPKFRPGHMLTYFGCVLLVALASLPVAIGAVLVTFAATALGTHPAFIVLLLFAVFIALFVVGYRIGVILPATAVDRPLQIGTAWNSTKQATGVFVALAVISLVCTMVIDLPATLLRSLPSGSLLALTWLGISGWLKMMVGVSILTTIYGHYVEGRTLASAS